MGNLRVGLCSWTDMGLVRSGWYPREARDAERRLRHYASRFDVVEVDSTYYGIPDETAAWRWVARTPIDFLFNIKVFGLFTLHAVARKNLPSWVIPEGKDVEGKERFTMRDFSKPTLLEIWERFMGNLSPLQATGKLGYLLFQFPPYVGFSHALERYLYRVREVAGPVRIAVEARNGTWLAGKTGDRFLGVLRDLNMAYVGVDEPSLSWTVPAEWPVTASWGSVVRFHGRNSAAWEKKDAGVSEKFRYLYSPEELYPWKNRILETSARVEKLFVMFNNCYADYAVQNANWMKRLLGFTVQETDGSQGILDYGPGPEGGITKSEE